MRLTCARFPCKTKSRPFMGNKIFCSEYTIQHWILFANKKQKRERPTVKTICNDFFSYTVKQTLEQMDNSFCITAIQIQAYAKMRVRTMFFLLASGSPLLIFFVFIYARGMFFNLHDCKRNTQKIYFQIFMMFFIFNLRSMKAAISTKNHFKSS